MLLAVVLVGWRMGSSAIARGGSRNLRAQNPYGFARRIVSTEMTPLKCESRVHYLGAAQ